MDYPTERVPRTVWQLRLPRSTHLNSMDTKRGAQTFRCRGANENNLRN